eukprot:m.13269 g.13269  ORF g.13269 m.13269 type:complete len:50 (+) comp7196_c0_seq1:357-506(+)
MKTMDTKEEETRRKSVIEDEISSLPPFTLTGNANLAHNAILTQLQERPN